MVCPSGTDSSFGVSLFERLEAGAYHESSREPDLGEVLASVKRNITHLLNTRLGESLSAPGLGLVDFNDAALDSRDLALTIRRAISHCLLTYEPRIRDVDVRGLPDSSTLLGMQFHILASVSLGDLHRQVQIDLLLDSNKKYRVV